jgi:hypothetical protein
MFAATEGHQHSAGPAAKIPGEEKVEKSDQ